MTRATMTIWIAAPTGYGGVRHIAVSLPRIDCLIVDQPAKYALPELPVADVRPDAPARRPRWTSWDNGGYRRRRQRDEAELADMLGDPP